MALDRGHEDAVAWHDDVPCDALAFRSEVEDSAYAGGAAFPCEGPFVPVHAEELASCVASCDEVEDMDADVLQVVADSSMRRIQLGVQEVAVQEVAVLKEQEVLGVQPALLVWVLEEDPREDLEVVLVGDWWWMVRLRTFF